MSDKSELKAAISEAMDQIRALESAIEDAEWAKEDLESTIRKAEEEIERIDDEARTVSPMPALRQWCADHGLIVKPQST